MTWQEFTALLALATAMSFSPGPNTTLSTALAANGGLPRAMRFIVAVPVGWTLLLALCAGGIGALVVAAPSLRWVIQTLGVAYLLWLAWKLSGSGTIGPADGKPLQVGFRQGVMLQFVNIKAWLLALTLVANWIAGQPDALRRFAIVAPVMLLYAFTSNFVYALTGSLLRNWLVHGQRLLWFNRAMAGVLVLTACWMARV
ncbi:LysE family translocator [Variovorax soli]|uniref:Threonine/homoserine/homoserine lactone efflux protein n=1 Tax=Variovorax soli TaxID=376815 RepID=A0ABU1NM99_9BURK|nr:LysE family translocator [Variovorax soli]MDR6539590.1 threonine/homoserine/homoserine lactone efflux protein [Variovorax soli]